MHDAFVNDDGPVIEAVESELGGHESFSLSDADPLV